ncbi:hypothetical protein HK096_000950, partial [Nowakowskiella sp. JEL0078]
MFLIKILEEYDQDTYQPTFMKFLRRPSKDPKPPLSTSPSSSYSAQSNVPLQISTQDDQTLKPMSIFDWKKSQPSSPSSSQQSPSPRPSIDQISTTSPRIDASTPPAPEINKVPSQESNQIVHVKPQSPKNEISPATSELKPHKSHAARITKTRNEQPAWAEYFVATSNAILASEEHLKTTKD